VEKRSRHGQGNHSGPLTRAQQPILGGGVALSRAFRVVSTDSASVLVASERTAIELRGALYVALLPRLDGTKTADELAEELAEFPPERVYYALLRLEQRGLLERNGTAAQPLAHAVLAIESFGEVHDAQRRLTQSLRQIGARIAGRDEDATARIVLTEDYLRDDFGARAQRLCEDGIPWFAAKPVGSAAWIGPFFRPGSAPLWKHLRRRLTENRLASLGLAGHSAIPTFSAQTPLEPALDAATGAIAIAIARALGSDAADAAESERRTSFITLDLSDVRSQTHDVVAAGGGDPPYSPFEPWALHARVKQYTYDGGHRICTPRETCERLRRFVDPLVGIIPELNFVGDAVASVYSARQNVAAALAVRDGVRVQKSWGAAGKGATREQAEASCLAEAVERYCCSFRGDEPRKRATLSQLGESAISPDAIQLYSQRQFETRGEFNATASGHHRVPLPFRDDAEIEWSPAWSLTHARTRWIPTANCYLSYPRSPEHDFFGGTSNGLASGNVVEEAILQGALELIERDAAAIWWYNRLRVPAVDLASFGDPYLERMYAHHADAGRTLEVLDVTSDLGIPAMVAVSRVTATGGRIYLGCGAHLDPRVAASRAISELMQLGIREFTGAPSDEELEGTVDAARLQWIRRATIEAHPYLLPLETPRRRAADYAQLASGDLLDDVNLVLDRAKGARLEVLALDATRADVGFPVVRIFAPGLRHFFARLGAGRLYDVPVRIGHIAQPLREDQLNPVYWIYS